MHYPRIDTQIQKFFNENLSLSISKQFSCFKSKPSIFFSTYLQIFFSTCKIKKFCVCVYTCTCMLAMGKCTFSFCSQNYTCLVILLKPHIFLSLSKVFVKYSYTLSIHYQFFDLNYILENYQNKKK